MKLSTKLLLSFGLVLLVTLSLVEFIGYRQTKAQILEEMRQDGIETRDILLAIRKIYQRQFVRSGIPLNKKTVGFIPAHSINRISREMININGRGLIFKNVSDRPRNPDNQADKIELEAMTYFRTNPKESERLIYVDKADRMSYYHFSSPIWIEQQCLQCHGKRNEAPPSIANTYTTAFDYKLGDLRGLLSIKLPTTLIDNRVLTQRLEDIWGRLVAFVLTFAFGGWLLHGLIIQRITLLQSMAKKIALGDLTTRLPAHGKDELSDLTSALNNMAEQRQQTELLQYESKQQVQDLLNSTAEAIYGLNMQGNCTFANRSCLDILGYQNSNDLVGHHIHNLIHHSKADGSNHLESECPIHHVLLSGNPSHVDSDILWRADGSSFSAEYWSHPIYRSGKMVGCVVTFIDITKRKAREKKILHQAHFDTLTNLPNRFLSLDRLNQLISEAHRNSEQVAVMFLDLDDFKKINDSLGHEAGDKLLIETAQRLSNKIRDGDTVGRLGGDEFIILLGQITTTTDASAVAENILDTLRNPFMVDGRELILTASIGIAIYPDDGTTQSDLLRSADSAMYHSKEEGRNTYSYFTAKMNQGVTRRLLLEEHIRGALGRNEFHLHYQPKRDVASNKIVGVETLLRWHNPALGEVMPTEFIPIAEQTGVIIPIGQFVLEQALGMAVKWQQQREDTFIVAVNLSPRQFRDPNLVTQIKLVIERIGATAKSLELEITEGVLMSGHNHIRDALTALSKLGVGITMDNFGTGYSSLSYLRNYPFDILKIDRSFINNITANQADRELVNATIAMAHSLGVKVVAEGVETKEQLQLLAIQGCDLAQGYLFSKPVPPEEITKMLET